MSTNNYANNTNTNSNNTSKYKNSDFIQQNQLGSGSFANVYKVQHKITKEIYALKIIDFNSSTTSTKEKDKLNALTEIRILASIKHTNIIGYTASWFTTKDNLYILMEYAENGDLSNIINNSSFKNSLFSESKIWSVLIQLLLGLYSLHSKQIIHRDLKPQNIFVTNNFNTYKIGDLNVSKLIKTNIDYKNLTQLGTPYYAAPEVWLGKCFNEKCDIWSLGVIIYELCCLKVPFIGKNINEVFNNIISSKYEEINVKNYGSLKYIINQMLNKEPSQRPSAFDILASDLVDKILNKLENISNGYFIMCGVWRDEISRIKSCWKYSKNSNSSSNNNVSDNIRSNRAEFVRTIIINKNENDINIMNKKLPIVYDTSNTNNNDIKYNRKYSNILPATSHYTQQSRNQDIFRRKSNSKQSNLNPNPNPNNIKKNDKIKEIPSSYNQSNIPISPSIIKPSSNAIRRSNNRNNAYDRVKMNRSVSHCYKNTVHRK